MFNSSVINGGPLNGIGKFTGTPTGEIVSSSFSSTLSTKYGFKSTGWKYFNFNNIEIAGTRYGNRITEHNFDDIAEVEVYKYGNALKNWGTIYDRRYREKSLNITIVVYSDNITNLENEIKNLKTALEIGGECFKNERGVSLKINAQLVNIEVSRLIVTGTTVTIKMLSMDPFWSTRNAVTTFNEGNSGSFSWSLTLLNTKIKGFAKHIIYAKTVTWSITGMTLTIGGYPLTINQTIVSGTPIVLDGINSDAMVNGEIVKYLGQFPELEINRAYALSVNFTWTGSVDEFDLYNIYENKQL